MSWVKIKTTEIGLHICMCVYFKSNMLIANSTMVGDVTIL